jgi:glyoxylase-like metal-dependent hydrolase (beta-lactamase superfamily II)
MSITTKCRTLEVGRIRRDAGALFGEFPFDKWGDECITGSEKSNRAPEPLSLNRHRRFSLPANVLVIRTESELILVDTGTPAVHEDHASANWTGSRLRLQLKTINTTLKEITKVVLTSFDIDHAGGLTHIDRAANLVYSFAHAEVYYHASTQERHRPRTIETANEAAVMLENNPHHSFSEATEIAPGIILHPIIGPSLQGCIVEVNRGADRLLYLGDLCPTVYHVNPTVIPAFDDNPEATHEERLHWLGIAKNDGHKVIFGHGAQIKAAWIEDNKGGLVIKPA